MKLVIFDVDGTLVETKSDATFRKSADDWQWLPGRLEKCKQLRGQGIRLAVATNQGGVAFGYMEESDIRAEIQRLCTEADITQSSTCYTHPKATLEQYRGEDHWRGQPRRKPGPGMLQEIMHYAACTLEETLFVGDRPEDEQAAQAAGCSFQWADEFFK